MSWLSRLTNVFLGRTVNRDLDEELRFHIEERTDQLIREGRSHNEASREARRMLGSPLQLRESSRDIKLLPRLESILRDIQFGARMLLKNPVVTGGAILSLSLAIGACTAAFSLIEALILRPLPVKEPSKLVSLAIAASGGGTDTFSYPLYNQLLEAGRDTVELFGMSHISYRRTATFENSGGQDEKVRAQYVAGTSFALLGIQPALGRVLTREDDLRPGDHPVAVISHGFWERRFGSDPNIIGRWLTMNAKQYQIIGIAQKGFWGVEPGFLTDMWVPMMMWEAQAFTNSGWSWFRIWGRLKPGVDLDQARASLQPAFRNFRMEWLRTFPPASADRARADRFVNAPLEMRTAANGPSNMRKDFERPLWILAGVAGLVLLIACSNVANLFTARAAAREREMALRLSIGAGRARLIQQVLIESLLLAGAASALALIFARAVAPLIIAMLSPSSNPAYLDLRIDWPAVAFVSLLCGLTTLLFGIAPALRASNVSPNNALKEGGQKNSAASGVFRPLVAAQVGFSFVVLFIAGLLLLTFQKLNSADPGFVANGLALFSIEARDLNQDLQARNVALQLLDHVRQLSGVESASLSEWALFEGSRWSSDIQLPGGDTESVAPFYLPVSPGFFATMGMRLVDGRDFEPRDCEPDHPSAVVVNEAFVRQFFPAGNPLGKSFGRVEREGLAPQEIIGVIRDAKYDSVRAKTPPTVYVPYRGSSYAVMELRTALDPLIFVSTLGEELRRIHPSLKITEVNLQSTLVNNTLLRERLLALLSGFFAIVALALGAVGLYGVLNYSVVRRTREIGIRIALGAQPFTVVRLVINDVALLVVIGLTAGTAAGLWLAQFVATLLYEVKPSDFWSLVLPIFCLLATALLAAMPPALRAARVDPMEALRHE